MGKASIDTSLTETLIIATPDLDYANKIRLDLQNNFAYCWFFVYKNAEIFATNEWGGKLNSEVVKALQDAAHQCLNKINKSAIH